MNVSEEEFARASHRYEESLAEYQTAEASHAAATAACSLLECRAKFSRLIEGTFGDEHDLIELDEVCSRPSGHIGGHRAAHDE